MSSTKTRGPLSSSAVDTAKTSTRYGAAPRRRTLLRGLAVLAALAVVLLVTALAGVMTAGRAAPQTTTTVHSAPAANLTEIGDDNGVHAEAAESSHQTQTRTQTRTQTCTQSGKASSSTDDSSHSSGHDSNGGGHDD